MDQNVICQWKDDKTLNLAKYQKPELEIDFFTYEISVLFSLKGKKPMEIVVRT